MPILNIQADNMAETGLVPQFIYINTDDDVATVTSDGYLNGAVSLGTALKNTDMALVVTRDTPNSRNPVPNLYQVSFVTGNWSLIPVGGGSSSGAWLLGGNAITGEDGTPEVFGTLSNNPVVFRADNNEYMVFNTALNRLDVSADNFHVSVTGISSIAAATVLNEGSSSVGVGSLSTPQVVIGNAGSGSNEVSIEAPILVIPNIPNATGANVLYFNTSDRTVSYGTAGSGSSLTINVQNFSGPGSFTYTPTAGMKYCSVQAVGGGGAGGGCTATDPNRCGGGGGAGGYCEQIFAAVDIGPSQSVVVGVGGTGATGGTGTDGGNSTFGSFLTAGGGSGGFPDQGAAGGGGGTATGGVIHANGCDGGSAFVTAGVPDFGTVYYAGNGAPSYFGGGVVGIRGDDATSEQNGNNGGAAGAAGGGAFGFDNSFRGGNGAAGQVIITEYI